MTYIIYILQFIVIPSVWAFVIDYIRTRCFRKTVHLITTLDSFLFGLGGLFNIFFQGCIIDFYTKPNQSLNKSEAKPILIGLLMSLVIFTISLQYAWYKRHKKGGTVSK